MTCPRVEMKSESQPTLDPRPSLRLSKMLGAPLLPSSFCPLLLQSLPSAQPQPQLQKRRTSRVSPRSPRARKKFPPTPHLLLTSRHWCGIPNQFISFPRWSVRELTQGNRSPWLCLQPNRLELLPPPNPAGSGEVAPPNNSAQCLFSPGKPEFADLPLLLQPNQAGTVPER